jgi:alpha-methylacyl-CoA racemase
MLFADLGADVVLIERPDDGASGVPMPRSIDLLCRGKRSIVIDLKAAAGRALALRLAARADILIEGFRPGVMERLGLGPDACLAGNPRLVYGRMTGWGQHGPLAERAGHDITYIALTGVLHAVGRAGGPPVPPLNLAGDFGGGALYLAVGLLAALVEARTSGRGQVVDAAIVDGAASLVTMFHGLLHAGAWTDRRGTNLLDSGCPWYDVYETLDHRWIAVGAIEPRFFAAFIEGLGLSAGELPGQWETGRWPEMRARLAARVRERTRDDWNAVFAGADACVAPVLSLSEAPRHPHARARASHITVDGIEQPAPAPRFSETPGGVRGGPPDRGAHSREVLDDWLGVEAGA